MCYSYDFKRKAVELFRQGLWLDTPDGLSDKEFHRSVRVWARTEDS